MWPCRGKFTSVFLLNTIDNASADLIPIFKPLLYGIVDLMKLQIRLAMNEGLQIQVWVFLFQKFAMQLLTLVNH
jgi:hypothetical protein